MEYPQQNHIHTADWAMVVFMLSNAALVDFWTDEERENLQRLLKVLVTKGLASKPSDSYNYLMSTYLPEN